MIKNSKTEDAQGRRERGNKIYKNWRKGKYSRERYREENRKLTEFLEKKKEMEEGRRKRT